MARLRGVSWVFDNPKDFSRMTSVAVVGLFKEILGGGRRGVRGTIRRKEKAR
jgi:hypothetical protein